MPRPPADVIVPFAGDAAGLPAVLARLAALQLRDGDTATLVDNRPATAAHAAPRPSAPVRVLRAPQVGSAYFARNRGAAAGSAPWLVFLDADVRYGPDLLDRLLDPEPAADVAVLAGAVADAVVTDTAVARHARDRAAMSQHRTLHAPRPYAQTAHCAVRRRAFHAVGGFAGDVRSGADADLCLRLAAAGWRLEERGEAVVLHEARASLRAACGQLARHGSGAAWLERRHPGALPRRPPARLAVWAARAAASAAWSAARGERGRATDAALEASLTCAFELGRLLPNQAPTGARRTALDGWLR